MKLLYLANIRLPTEKAHGLQIMQMCEAFAQAGPSVTLIVPDRVNSPELANVDSWAYYGVSRSFAIRRLFCLDLFRWGLAFEQIAFVIQTFTYLVTLLFAAGSADVYYSRDIGTLLALSLFRPRSKLCYEAHQLAISRFGATLQSWCVRRVGTVVAVTGKLGADLETRGAQRVIIAHDGFRAERFANLPDCASARAKLKLPVDAFIVGYMGRLQTMAMSKGIDHLIDAIASIPDRKISLYLVGGPVETAQELQAYWQKRGLPADSFLLAGHVSPADVPAYLAAFDVCAMTFPTTDHFAYYASPLKLFEYMASGRAIVSSNHPATAEVVRDGETGLLVPPEDVPALADALRRLYDDLTLRERLGAAAKRESAQYSWQARAECILQFITEAA
jgi:glycosyltransferase involved in cell wall biosynthesis